MLELVSSDYLFHNYNEYPEGELTKLRASIVCEQSLAMCAEAISLGKYLRLGNGEDSTGGRLRASITSDAMEALIGAIYLDGGFANAKEFITRFVLNDLENKKLFYAVSYTHLRFVSIASGSSGNCTYIGTDHTHLLVDAGISCKRIDTGVQELGIKPDELAGVLITHEHSDHISGIRVFSKRCV